MGVAYNFNPTQHNPNFGGGGDSLGIGKHPVVGSKVELKNAKDNNGNGYLALTVTAIDGPQKGGTKTIRYNLHNSSEVAQRIANEQLAATCLVMGVTGPWSDCDVLLNKPFVIENTLQAGDNPKGYTDVTAVYTMDGRTVQDAMQNPPKTQGNTPAGFGASGSAPSNTGNGGGAPSGGGWSMAAGADTNQQQQQQQAPAEQQGGGNAWGGNGGGGGSAPAGGGWSQGASGGATGGGGWGQSA